MAEVAKRERGVEKWMQFGEVVVLKLGVLLFGCWLGVVC